MADSFENYDNNLMKVIIPKVESYGLKLVTAGDLALSNEQGQRSFNFGKEKNCSIQACALLAFQYELSNKDECLGEFDGNERLFFPNSLQGGFYSSIPEGNNRVKSFMKLFDQGVCYEVRYGMQAKMKRKMQEILNLVISFNHPQPKAEIFFQSNDLSRFPARPAKKNGVVSCNTNCINGDCRRTYDSGRKVRFQAKHKYDVLSGTFVWDSGSCIAH